MSRATRLDWVCILGRTWMGFGAYKRLLEVVILCSKEQVISFLNAGQHSSRLARHFATISRGESLHPLRFTKSLYIAFETEPYDDLADSPFHLLFHRQLAMFTNLRIFTFDISEFDENCCFLTMSNLINGCYPPSLEHVRMVSSASKVSTLHILVVWKLI